MSETRIFIVDDHPIVRHGLKALIESNEGFVVVGEGSDSVETLAFLSTTSCDIVLVDLSLKEGLGLALIREIKSKWNQLPVLVVSMHDRSLYSARSRESGASGYLMKQDATTQIIQALKSILEGGTWFESDEVYQDSDMKKLSDREIEIFELIGRGLSTRECADKLSLSVKTIETHRDNIKAKLKLKNSNTLVHRAISWFHELN